MAWVRPRCYWITALYRTIANGRKGGDCEMALFSLIYFPRKGAANLIAPHSQCWLTARSLCRAAPLNDRWMICEQRAVQRRTRVGDNLRGAYYRAAPDNDRWLTCEERIQNSARLVMSMIPKQKYKRSDIEANYQNETKTFWCVPKKEVEGFYLVQKL
jgi:hypothetical protein